MVYNLQIPTFAQSKFETLASPPHRAEENSSQSLAREVRTAFAQIRTDLTDPDDLELVELLEQHMLCTLDPQKQFSSLYQEWVQRKTSKIYPHNPKKYFSKDDRQAAIESNEKRKKEILDRATSRVKRLTSALRPFGRVADRHQKVFGDDALQVAVNITRMQTTDELNRSGCLVTPT